jgi:SpoVK/Ycf46/Vps4 family AAA+-type ATPase
MESLGRCVILLDEIEKFFSTDATSGGGDSGVSSRMFGTFVSWMSLKTCPVFIIGTLNNFDRLPPELTRKGRFDEVFFVDLPTDSERSAIFTALIKYKFKVAAFENCVTPELIEATESFSGAEIEAVIEEALYGLLEAPNAKGEDLLLSAAKSIKPQAKLEPELVAQLRKKSEGFKQASLAEEPPPAPPAQPKGRRNVHLN